MGKSAPPCGLGYVLAWGGPPFSRRHHHSGNLEGAGYGAVFLKVLRDRPTFAATQSECVPPRVPGRAWVLSQRARARRMRQFGRDGRALRRFVALSGSYIARRNHTQAGERRAGEALVRAGAGFYDDRRTGEAGAA